MPRSRNVASGLITVAEQIGHHIQFDQPELTIEAINHALEADRTRDLLQ